MSQTIVKSPKGVDLLRVKTNPIFRSCPNCYFGVNSRGESNSNERDCTSKNLWCAKKMFGKRVDFHFVKAF